MEGLQVVRSLLQKGDFMMKLDLKDAYYAIPIHPSYRKYLRFVYQELWAVALEAGVSLTAQHIPGIQNGVADTASRQLESRTEWTLDKGIFQSVCQRFYTPEVDLFASRLTHQVPNGPV